MKACHWYIGNKNQFFLYSSYPLISHSRDTLFFHNTICRASCSVCVFKFISPRSEKCSKHTVFSWKINIYNFVYPHIFPGGSPSFCCCDFRTVTVMHTVTVLTSFVFRASKDPKDSQDNRWDFSHYQSLFSHYFPYLSSRSHSGMGCHFIIIQSIPDGWSQVSPNIIFI